MAADGVVGQCRRIRCLTGDLSVRNQSQFDQCLESVTDTKGQSVPLFQKSGNGFFHLCILECRCEEFCRTIRFITC